jgi:hypothetical protein
MDAISRDKLRKAGYTIVREGEFGGKPVIKRLTNTFGSWCTHMDGFASKAERDRALRSLINENPMVISD